MTWLKQLQREVQDIPALAERVTYLEEAARAVAAELKGARAAHLLEEERALLEEYNDKDPSAFQ